MNDRFCLKFLNLEETAAKLAKYRTLKNIAVFLICWVSYGISYFGPSTLC